MKKTIAVIFGGKSAEHDVSIVTAYLSIINVLVSTNKYDVIPVYITKDGQWYSDEKMVDLNYFKENLDSKIKKLNKIKISFDNGFRIIKNGIFKKNINIDLVFPAMHGTYGEDGSLMGLLRMADVPFVGCDMDASVIAMDKAFSKQIWEQGGLPVVPYRVFKKDEYDISKVEGLKWPLFVKPVHLGSSIGMSKVKDKDELEKAIEVAFHYDDKILIEESIEELIEVTLPIMGNKNLTLATVERPLNKSEFFNFEDKYIGQGGKKTGSVNNNYSEIPANISPELMEEVKNLGQKAYKTIGCTGISRVDFLIDGSSGKVYVNEINTLPGGLYDHNWRKSGISNSELVEKLIFLAEEKYKNGKETQYTFNSTILDNLNGSKIKLM